ncbi:MAG: EVE domain-containing protein [Verrucomicrobiota bacterium]|jgi:predicted RNA-binding protein with PUA-like domain|nr:EVE domain-containing protein [Verrucomicrobiota bacterium]
MTRMARSYWLVKQEPEAYSWDDFVKEGETYWDGVRNYQARNNLRAMKKGDMVFFYHSVSGKEVVGVARVTKEHYPDPTAKEGDWSVVDLAPAKQMKKAVTLAQIKDQKSLENIALIKQSRLSVMPITESEFRCILNLGETKLS